MKKLSVLFLIFRRFWYWSL